MKYDISIGKSLCYYYASKIIDIPNMIILCNDGMYKCIWNNITIVLRLTNTDQQNLFRLLPSLHHMGRTPLRESWEMCVTVFNGSRAARMVAVYVRDVVSARHAISSSGVHIIGWKSVKPVSLDGFDFRLCFYVKSYHSTEYNMN